MLSWSGATVTNTDLENIGYKKLRYTFSQPSVRMSGVGVAITGSLGMQAADLMPSQS
jgi:hypothetical protein